MIRLTVSWKDTPLLEREKWLIRAFHSYRAFWRLRCNQSKPSIHTMLFGSYGWSDQSELSIHTILFGPYVCIRICMFMDGFHIRYEILHDRIRHTQGKHILKYIFLYDATHDMPVCKINVFWNMLLKVQKHTEYFKIIFVFVALCSGFLYAKALEPS